MLSGHLIGSLSGIFLRIDINIISVEFLDFWHLGERRVKYFLSLDFCQCMHVYLLGRPGIETASKAEIIKKFLGKIYILKENTASEYLPRKKLFCFVLS